MVKDVEKLGAETKSQSFSDVKLTLQPDIWLPGPESPQYVAAEITLRSSGRRTKRCAIENLPARILSAEKLSRRSRDYVWASIESDAISRERCANNVDGWC